MSALEPTMTFSCSPSLQQQMLHNAAQSTECYCRFTLKSGHNTNKATRASGWHPPYAHLHTKEGCKRIQFQKRIHGHIFVYTHTHTNTPLTLSIFSLYQHLRYPLYKSFLKETLKEQRLSPGICWAVRGHEGVTFDTQGVQLTLISKAVSQHVWVWRYRDELCDFSKLLKWLFSSGQEWGPSPHVGIQELIRAAKPEDHQGSDTAQQICLLASCYQSSDKPNVPQTLRSETMLCIWLSHLSALWSGGSRSGRRCGLRFLSDIQTQNTYTRPVPRWAVTQPFADKMRCPADSLHSVPSLKAIWVLSSDLIQRHQMGQ